MNVQVTESGTWRRTLEIEAPAEDVDKRLNDAYRKYSKTLNLPGFRKGKIPLSVVKRQFGPAIQGEVVQEMVEEFYREASEAEGIQPVSQASIDDINFEEGQPLVFKASVDVRPEITVETYKELKVTRPVFAVEDEHVEGRLRYMQEERATEQVVERAADLDDVVFADVEELDDGGSPVPDHGSEDQSIRLFKTEDGKPTDLAEQLMGISAGEAREVKITRPVQDEPDHEDCDHDEPDHEDHDEGPKEETVMFRVTAKEIRERELPELDDELAQDVGGVETLDELKTQIRNEMQTQYEQMIRQRVEENLMDALIEENPFEVPDSMVENYLNGMIESYKQEQAGHDQGIDEDALREEGRDQAERGVKRFLLLDAVADQENIEVTDDDLDKHLEEMSQRHNIEGPRLRQILSRTEQLDQIESEIKTQKTFDFLIDNADVEDVEEVE
ncbi:MAG: trigger factor [Gemmatimonadetes bacterium]|nr:trigger factor [Gemmatimonadota bacterium]MYK53038.1 trigger factor [Gemmatimonadota bacterium]